MRLSPLPSCTFLIGYVLDDIATDGRDMFFNCYWILDCVLLGFVQGWFERFSRDACATEAVGGVPMLLAPYCPDIVRILCFDALLHFTSSVATALEVPATFLSKSLIFRKIS